MPFGPNRWGKHPKSSAIKAGGITMFYRHPKLAGHVADGTNIDEVDVSKACKLNETFLDAQPAMDSAFQEILVDGSVITITNTLLAGTLTLQVLEQGGFVGKGCFITALQLVQSLGDDVGGTFTTVRNFDGNTRVRVYYGVFVRNVPHERVAGNAVVPYPVQLYYSGWFDGVGPADSTLEFIWAVGNTRGTSGNYKPFAENDGDDTVRGGSVDVVNIHSSGLYPADDLDAIAGIPGNDDTIAAAVTAYGGGGVTLRATPNGTKEPEEPAEGGE
jgi:hypothetical protein